MEIKRINQIARGIVGTTCGLLLALASGPLRADLVLLGADYFETVAPTNFTFPTDPALGALGGTTHSLTGIVIGPGSTDTIVHRTDDCSLSLSTLGSNCTIPIEMVALSLVSAISPSLMIRESPTQASTGMMTIASDGSGMGGSFDSSFNIFVELSLDGGANYDPLGMLQLASAGSVWSTMEHGLMVSGLIGDQNANRHIDKATNCPVAPNMVCVDFYAVGIVKEEHPGVGVHSARQAVPEPGSLVLVGVALALLAGNLRRTRRGIR